MYIVQNKERNTGRWAVWDRKDLLKKMAQNSMWTFRLRRKVPLLERTMTKLLFPLFYHAYRNCTSRWFWPPPSSKWSAVILRHSKKHFPNPWSWNFINHWDPQQPYRGNAFRAITALNGRLDTVLTNGKQRQWIVLHGSYRFLTSCQECINFLPPRYMLISLLTLFSG